MDGSYNTLDGELQHTRWVKVIPEMLPEDVGTFLVKIKVEGSISRLDKDFDS